MRMRMTATVAALMGLTACENAAEYLMPIVHPIEIHYLFGIVTTTLHNTGKSGQFYIFVKDGDAKKCIQKAFLAHDERKKFTFMCALNNDRFGLYTLPELIAKGDKEFMALINSGA